MHVLHSGGWVFLVSLFKTEPEEEQTGFEDRVASGLH